MVTRQPMRVDLQLKGLDKTTNITFIPLHPITTVIGYSGSGKTYLCNFIKSLKLGNLPKDNFKSNVPLTDILVIDSVDSILAILGVSNKLIVIDNFNRTLRALNDADRQRVIDYINNSNNLYILMFRGASDEGLGVIATSISKLWYSVDIDQTTHHKTEYFVVCKGDIYNLCKQELTEGLQALN